MNHRMHQQALGIHQDMPFLPIDLLARFVTGGIDACAALFGAFHALAVDDTGRWNRPTHGISGRVHNGSLAASRHTPSVGSSRTMCCAAASPWGHSATD